MAQPFLLENFLNSGALLKVKSGSFIAAWGPFESLSTRPHDELVFYVPDFFLDDPAPWKRPAGWCEWNVNECPEKGVSPKIDWQPPSHDAFAEVFLRTEQLIQSKELTKLVPVMFEEGMITNEQQGDHRGSPLRWLLSRLGEIPKSVWPYGIWDETSGMFGATPEMLFEQSGGFLKTMSLAGTAPIRDTNRLVSHAKEKREHDLVIEGMTDRLKSFGEVVVGAREIIEMGQLAHLKTTIDVKLKQDVSCEEVVKALHPTPALGAVPRDRGMSLLRELDRVQQRGKFGAPFGVAWPDGRARFIVAIRALQWKGRQMRIGAGCGLVDGSTLQREWEELHLKRESVKRMFQV
ncbi:MAG: chorismate-binding protein [Deltaproteobacteria bacterium]|nr:chorismate-binding protein [Deltaproteobacteria bacterium]